MSEIVNVEEIFRKELYNKYDQRKKYILTKEEYYDIVAKVKEALNSEKTKSQEVYYYLRK